MKMNDNTILRIKVPARLYESVKAQLTLKEGKNDYGMPGAKTIKEKKTSDGPKKTSAPKNVKAPKNAKAPVKVTPYNAVKADKETSKMGAGVSETKKMGIEELKKLAELLNNEITKLEEKSHDKEDKEKVEEGKDIEEGREYDEFERDEEWDEETQSWVPVRSNRYRKFYKPKSHTGTATMTAQQADDVTKSSFSKFNPNKD